MRSGNRPQPLLYNLAEDPAETQNLARKHPEKLEELTTLLNGIAPGETD